jgi:deoxyribodipyrimidine photo-lyase
LYGLRKTPEARAEADAVQSRHGSRKSGMAQTGMRRRSGKAESAGKVAARNTTQAAQFTAAQPDLFAEMAEPAGDPSPGLA